MKRFIFLITIMNLLCTISSLTCAATLDFMPIVSNYSQASYSGGLQNWSGTQADNGQVFFGNNKGLLVFDGYFWNFYSLPSHSIVRSVLADGDRIYAGSYTDFGYYTRNQFGKYEYKSLWPRHYQAHNDEIWTIIKSPNGHIYFQSFCSWFDYDGEKVIPHYDPANLPLHFFNVRNQIYVQMVNKGLYLLQNERYVPLLNRATYKNDDIIGIVPFQKNKLLCITSKNGIYIYQNNKLTAWTTNIDQNLKSYQLNKATLQGDSTLVLGTILNGIYAIDLSTKRQLWHYNMANSLINNTVLGLFSDRNNNVWAAMDNGISLIHTGLPITVMRTDKLNLPIGMVYGMTHNGNDFYVATNQATWHYNLTSKEIQPVKNSNGQNWYVATFDHQTLAGHNLSTLSIVGNIGTPMLGNNEGSTCIKTYNANGQEVLIESSYNNFRIYRKEAHKWIMANVVQGFQSPILEFEIDNNGSIWAAHMSKGLYKLDLSQDLKKVIHQRYYGALVKDGIHSQIHVMKIRGRVVFSYQGHLYAYDDNHDAIIAYNDISFLSSENLISSLPINNTSFWTADNNTYSLFQYNGKKYRRSVCIPYKMFGLEVNTNGISLYSNGTNTYFFLNNGIGRYQIGTLESSFPHFPLSISEVTSANDNNQSINIDCGNTATNKIHSDNISFILTYPNYDHQQLTFRYMLEGNGKDLKAEVNKPVISFNSLGYGSYKLQVSVLSPDGKILGTTSYKFKRVVPFYLSIWAFIIYGLFASMLIKKYIDWRAYKIIRKNKQEAEENLMRQNLKVLEQKQIIAAQQQIIMENELSTKGKELATMAFQVAVQSTKADNLREELLEKKRKGQLTNKDFEELITDVKINGTDEAWNIFQQNFDLIHQSFFRNLRFRYPELTSTDLKFCALLRLNFNTKDIAKFTNLTVRGVEGARYRLRKKLGIKNNQSLTDFLIEIK